MRKILRILRGISDFGIETCWAQVCTVTRSCQREDGRERGGGGAGEGTQGSLRYVVRKGAGNLSFFLGCRFGALGLRAGDKGLFFFFVVALPCYRGEISYEVRRTCHLGVCGEQRRCGNGKDDDRIF